MSIHREHIEWQAQVSSCETTPARVAALYRRSASYTVQYQARCMATFNHDAHRQCNTAVKCIYVQPITQQLLMSHEDALVWDLGRLFDDADVDGNYANSTHECPHHSREVHADFVRSSLASGVGLRCPFCARVVIVDCHQVSRFYDKAHVDNTDALGETPLYIAARANQIQTARYLLHASKALPDALSLPLDVEVLSPMQNTTMSPVHIAAVQDHWAMVLLLVQNGTDVYVDYNSTDNIVDTPNTARSVVRLTVEAGHWVLVELMWLACLVPEDMAHDPAAHLELEFIFLIAARNGRWGVLLPWLQSMHNMTPFGACCELCNTTNKLGQRCLDYAIHNQAWNIVERLLMLGVMVVTSKWPGDSLIITAASNKAFSVVQMLLSCDANVKMPPMMDDLTAGGQVMYAASQNL